MISDNVAWLGYWLCGRPYLSTTGDRAILDEPTAFFKDELLGEKRERFFTPEASQDTASLYCHCVRGLDLAITRTGTMACR